MKDRFGNVQGSTTVDAGYKVMCPQCQLTGGAHALVSLQSDSEKMCGTQFIWDPEIWMQPRGTVYGCHRANGSAVTHTAVVSQRDVSTNRYNATTLAQQFSVFDVSCPDGQPNTCDEESSTDCVDGSFCVCASGRGPDASGTRCDMCAAGQYSNGGDPCSSCQVGRFSTVLGAGACQDCAVGRRSGDLDPRVVPQEDRQRCYDCQPGQYAEQTAAPACEKCSAGLYTNVLAARGCIECELGTYQDDEGE